MALASLAASGALTSAVSGVGTTALTTVCVGSLRLIATSSQDKRSAATVSTSEARPGLPDLGNEG